MFTRLRNLEIEVVDPDEVEPGKAANGDEAEEPGRFDLLDDPVRMYMKQMGKTPLLTREQEVAICKRIEEAEIEARAILYSFGFTAKEHIALAEKLQAIPPKERFDRVVADSLAQQRERHLKTLARIVKKVRELDETADQKFLAWQQRPMSEAGAGCKPLSNGWTNNFRDVSPNFISDRKCSRK